MRRTPFAAELRRRASAAGLDESGTATFQFRRRYNLPPTDPRFLDATMEQVVIDNWAHAHADDPKLRDERHETADFDEELRAAEAEHGIEAESDPEPLPDDPGDFDTLVDERYGG